MSSHQDPRVLYVIEALEDLNEGESEGEGDGEEELFEWLPQVAPEATDEAEDVFIDRAAAQEVLDQYIEDGNDPTRLRIVEYIPRFTIR